MLRGEPRSRLGGSSAASDVDKRQVQGWQAGPGHVGEGVVLVVVAGVEQQPIDGAIGGARGVRIVIAGMFGERLTQVGDAQFAKEEGERPEVVEQGPWTQQYEHYDVGERGDHDVRAHFGGGGGGAGETRLRVWLLYKSDAADDRTSVGVGGR